MGTSSTVKNLLIVALFSTVLAVVLFVGSMIGDRNKRGSSGRHVRTAGEILLICAAVFVFFAAGSSRRRGPPEDAKNSEGMEHVGDRDVKTMIGTSTGTSAPAMPVLLVLSADSWCGFSKQMTESMPAVTKALNQMGVETQLVSDSQNKAQFQALANQYGARGFPHSVVLVGETVAASFPGFMPVDQIKAKVTTALQNMR